MKPVIGIVPLFDETKDSLWMLPGYMDGISEAGGIPVMFPVTENSNDIAELIEKEHGVTIIAEPVEGEPDKVLGISASHNIGNPTFYDATSALLAPIRYRNQY